MHFNNIKENVFVRTLLSTNDRGSTASQSSNERSVRVNGSIAATKLMNYLIPRHVIFVAEEHVKLQTLNGLLSSSCVLMNIGNNYCDRNSNSESDNNNDNEEEEIHLDIPETSSMLSMPNWLELSIVKQESKSPSNKRTNANTTNAQVFIDNTNDGSNYSVNDNETMQFNVKKNLFFFISIAFKLASSNLL